MRILYYRRDFSVELVRWCSMLYTCMAGMIWRVCVQFLLPFNSTVSVLPACVFSWVVLLNSSLLGLLYSYRQCNVFYRHNKNVYRCSSPFRANVDSLIFHSPMALFNFFHAPIYLVHLFRLNFFFCTRIFTIEITIAISL